MRVLITLFLGSALIVAISCQQSPAGKPNMQMEILDQQFEHPDCITDDGPCVTLHFIYPLFEEENELFRKLGDWTNERIFNQQETATPQKLAQEWFRDYDQYANEIKNYTIAWILERRVEVAYQSDNLISLHYNEYSFTGGPHPTQIDIFRSFDKPNGEIITLDDLTYDQILYNQLERLAEEQFWFTYEVLNGGDPDNPEPHFSEGEFKLPENFAFTEYGLLFYYNIYELAPYATRPIAVEIPYEDLESILRARWLQPVDQLTRL